MSKVDEVVVPRFALETVMKIINGKGIYGAGIDALNTALAATPSPVAGGIKVEQIDAPSNWHVEGCDGGCIADMIEGLVKREYGTQGHDWLVQHLARRAVSAQEPVGWIEYGIDSKPLLGQRIVCEYKTGEVWAGKYGGAKHSFLRWMPLPPTDSGLDALAKRALSASTDQPYSRTYPCGCVLCICEGDERCHGCGAKSCGKSDAECDWKQQRIKAALSAPNAAEPVAWLPIESAPKDGRTLLLGHFNGCGKWRTLRGQWFTKAQIEKEWENDECDEGWYETSVENDDIPNCWPTEPSHYMLLPKPPLYAKPTDSGSGE